MKMSKSAVKASNAKFPRKRIMADAEVAPEAADLLFEAEDVAQLVAEITGEDVAVEATEDAVTFEVAGEVYTCEAEDEIEEVESSRKIVGKKPVKASRTLQRGRKIARRR